MGTFSVAQWLEPACNAGDAGLHPGLGSSPGEMKWQATPVFLPEKDHGQRSLVIYSPWSLKESDMTQHTQEQNNNQTQHTQEQNNNQERHNSAPIGLAIY